MTSKSGAEYAKRVKDICDSLEEEITAPEMKGQKHKERRRGLRELIGLIGLRDDVLTAQENTGDSSHDRLIDRSDSAMGISLDVLEVGLRGVRGKCHEIAFRTADGLITAMTELIKSPTASTSAPSVPSREPPPAADAPVQAGETTVPVARAALTSAGVTPEMTSLVSEAMSEVRMAQSSVGIVGGDVDLDVKALIELFAYQGFDPCYLRAALVDIAANKGRDVVSDMVIICTAIITMGTNTDKAKAGITKAAAKLVDDLLGAAKGYSFHTGAMSAAGLNKRTAMTTNRMGHVFPEVMLGVMARTPSHFSPVGYVDCCPKWACFPGFLSVLPNIKSASVLDLVVAHLKYADCFNTIISKDAKGGKTSRQAAKASDATDWQELAWGSNLFSNHERVEILEMNLTDSIVSRISSDFKALSAAGDPGASQGFPLSAVRAILAAGGTPDLAGVVSAAPAAPGAPAEAAPQATVSASTAGGATAGPSA